MPAPSDIAPQEKIDKVRELIQNRLLDISDFFETGDFAGTCTNEDLENFKALLNTIGYFTDDYNCTGCIGKVVE